MRLHRRPTIQPVRRKNMLLQGGGGGTTQDRGAMQSSAYPTSNPYYANNFLYRWQEYVRWYMTAWEAKKLIDIPVEDALRKPFELEGIESEQAAIIQRKYDEMGLETQTRRALIQERLLGGCAMTIVMNRPEGEELKVPLDLRTVEKGDLLAFNVIDVSRITRPYYSMDPFDADYDRATCYTIQGVEVDQSRLIVLDGKPLVNRAAMNILQNFRYNPAGFGESKLAPLYDLLTRVVGTQQAAYHLVNMASVLLIKADNFMSVQATANPAVEKLEEVCREIGIYRGAVIDGKNVDVTQHTASFGSVPELVMSFVQLLSAAGDIPATRFLGQAPGGLNATGESDLQNYYNSIDAYQRLTVEPITRRQVELIACSEFGYEQWLRMEQDLDIVFPPLWNLSAKDMAEMDRTYAEIMRTMYESGLLTRDNVVNELLKRDFFKSSSDAVDFLTEEGLADPASFSGGGFYNDAPEKDVTSIIEELSNGQI